MHFIKVNTMRGYDYIENKDLEEEFTEESFVLHFNEHLMYGLLSTVWELDEYYGRLVNRNLLIQIMTGKNNDYSKKITCYGAWSEIRENIICLVIDNALKKNYLEFDKGYDTDLLRISDDGLKFCNLFNCDDLDDRKFTSADGIIEKPYECDCIGQTCNDRKSNKCMRARNTLISWLLEENRHNKQINYKCVHYNDSLRILAGSYLRFSINQIFMDYPVVVPVDDLKMNYTLNIAIAQNGKLVCGIQIIDKHIPSWKESSLNVEILANPNNSNLTIIELSADWILRQKEKPTILKTINCCYFGYKFSRPDLDFVERCDPFKNEIILNKIVRFLKDVKKIKFIEELPEFIPDPSCWTKRTPVNEKNVGHKKKKLNIPKALRDQVWIRYIGETVGKGKCYVCDGLITPFNYECGHIISEYKGGEINIENLRPMHSTCNKSVGTRNANDFKKKYMCNNNDL